MTDPDSVEWELYVLDHDIEDSTDQGCGCNVEPLKITQGLPVTKSTACCAPA